jgi:hypothetical protein
VNRAASAISKRVGWIDRTVRQPQNRLLLACAGEWASQDTLEAVSSIAARGDVDWSAFVEASLRHGVTPSAADYLVRTEMESLVPRAARDFFHRFRAANEARNRALLAETGRVVDVLRASGIRSMVLKGAALSTTAYPKPRLRTFADIDILVDPDCLSDAEKVVAGLGYAAERSIIPNSITHECRRMCAEDILSGTLAPELIAAHAAYLNEDYCNRIVLELHRGLFRTLDGLWRRVDMELLWESAATFSLSQSHEAQMLGPEAMLVHLAAHAGDHAFGRLLFPIDASFVISANEGKLAWQHVAELARIYDVAGRVLTLLSHAREICGAEIPEKALTALGTQRALQSAAPVSTIFSASTPVGTEVALRRLFQTTRFADMATSVARLLGPPPSVIREIYGARSLPMVGLCYAIRPFHLAGRALRILARSAAAGRP